MWTYADDQMEPIRVVTNEVTRMHVCGGCVYDVRLGTSDSVTHHGIGTSVASAYAAARTKLETHLAAHAHLCCELSEWGVGRRGSWEHVPAS